MPKLPTSIADWSGSLASATAILAIPAIVSTSIAIITLPAVAGKVTIPVAIVIMASTTSITTISTYLAVVSFIVAMPSRIIGLRQGDGVVQ